MNGSGKRNFSNGMIILLVLLNLALLVTFWYARSKPAETIEPVTRVDDPGRYGPDRPGPGPDKHRDRQGERLERFLEKELGFTKQQVNEFSRLREEHFNKTSTLRRQMDDLRKEMMGHLLDADVDKDLVNSLADSMGEKMAGLEKATFFHLLELLKLGDSEQQSKYKRLMREILEQMRPPEHGGPPGAGPPRGRPPGGRDHWDGPPRHGDGHPDDGPPDGRPPVESSSEREEKYDFGERPESHLPGQGEGDNRGPESGDEFFSRLVREVRLNESQKEKLRPIVKAAYDELERIPSDSRYSEHEQRRYAAEGVHKQLHRDIETYLTQQQVELFRRMDKGHRPERPPGHGPPGKRRRPPPRRKHND